MTLEERIAHMAAAKKKLDTKIPWLADSMQNDLKHAFGDRNNSEFVISADGKIAIARTWSDPSVLRSDLEKLVGKSKTITTPADLDRKPQTAEASKYARGVVSRVERPPGAKALVTKLVSAKETKSDHQYAKLRAEMAPDAIRANGKGTLYLGFHLDLIYNVHWNNLAEPLRWKLKAPEGVTLSVTEGVAPKIEAEADIDPREFLVDLEFNGAVPKEPLELEVYYFACHDVDAWCRAVTQQYKITFEVDRDGGRATSGAGGRRGSSGRPDPAQMLTRMDRNGDGKLSIEEAPERMRERFSSIDSDSDGFLSKSEIEARFNRR
ncbi:hypothetical protein OAF27_02360 [Verrucomicrobiales bacterium]|nr:hypothetical protein [Verrucomicrobiales bacterium]